MGRRAALLTLDAEGVGLGIVKSSRYASAGAHLSVPVDDPIRLAQAAIESRADFVVIQLGDTARAEAARAALSPATYRAVREAALRRADICFYLLTAQLVAENLKADVLLVSPRPPADASFPTTWERPTPFSPSARILLLAC